MSVFDLLEWTTGGIFEGSGSLLMDIGKELSFVLWIDSLIGDLLRLSPPKPQIVEVDTVGPILQKVTGMTFAPAHVSFSASGKQERIHIKHYEPKTHLAFVLLGESCYDRSNRVAYNRTHQNIRHFLTQCHHSGIRVLTAPYIEGQVEEIIRLRYKKFQATNVSDLPSRYSLTRSEYTEYEE